MKSLKNLNKKVFFLFLIHLLFYLISCKTDTLLVEKYAKEYKRYKEFYEKFYRNILKNNIIIFFDPAHGMNKRKQWTTIKTDRVSGTGKTEEFYSLKIARALYKLLKAYRSIKIISTEDYIKALEKQKDWYYDIHFKETLELSHKAGATLLISEHLNNVWRMYKKDGWQRFGIFISNYKGKKYLIYNPGTYTKGAMVLFSYLDCTGAGYKIAKKTLEKMKEHNFPINKGGIFPDRRFSIFFKHPIGIIFESGYISNKKEEKILKRNYYAKLIAESQVEGILNGIKILKKIKDKNLLNEYKDLCFLTTWSAFLAREREYKTSCEIIKETIEKYHDIIPTTSRKRYIDFKNRVCTLYKNPKKWYRIVKDFYTFKTFKPISKNISKHHRKKYKPKKGYIIVIPDLKKKRKYIKESLGYSSIKIEREITQKGIYILKGSKIIYKNIVPLDKKRYNNIQRIYKIIQKEGKKLSSFT